MKKNKPYKEQSEKRSLVAFEELIKHRSIISDDRTST